MVDEQMSFIYNCWQLRRLEVHKREMPYDYPEYLNLSLYKQLITQTQHASVWIKSIFARWHNKHHLQSSLVLSLSSTLIKFISIICLIKYAICSIHIYIHTRI